MQAEIYRTLKVTRQQSLSNQTVHICNKRGVHFQKMAQQSLKHATARDSVQMYNTVQSSLQTSLLQAGTYRDAYVHLQSQTLYGHSHIRWGTVKHHLPAPEQGAKGLHDLWNSYPAYTARNKVKPR